MAEVIMSITINVMDDGKVGMVGPLHDKVMCYGMLEVARDIVHDHKAERPSGIMVVPPLGGLKSN